MSSNRTRAITSHAITSHARHDPGHVLAPGLFRALRRGERPRLVIEYRHGDHYLRWQGPYALGADDLRILQGLVALAGPQGGRLGPDPVTTTGQRARRDLAVEGDADAIGIRTTLGRLLTEIGQRDGGDQRRQAIACLDRLAGVTIIEQKGRERWSSRILSYHIDTETGALVAGLNPRIARAVWGRRHTRIPMAEVRSLAGASDATRLLHQRLCGVVDPGRSRRIGIDVLCRYVWPSHESAPGSTRRYHRARAREAMAILAKLPGWLVRETTAGQWLVQRPRQDPC